MPIGSSLESYFPSTGNGDKEEESSNLVPRMRRIQRVLFRERGKNGVGDR